MTTGRSPNYPSLTLIEALDRLRALYDGIHTRSAEREIIAQNLGYKGLNGRSLTLIATLMRYGLLTKEGKGRLRVSDRAVSILELGRGSLERIAAIKDAAFESALFAQLYNDFGEKLVAKDETLKHYLIKKDFLPKAAEEIIRVYRANLELVNEEAEAYDAPMPQAATNLRSPTKEEIQQVFSPRTAVSAGAPDAGNDLKFKISRGSEAHVVFTGEVTQEGIDKLSQLLLLQKDSFPKQVELDSAEINRIADMPDE